jgi:hypothetical protein
VLHRILCDVTTKEQLHELVEHLGHDEAAEALTLLRARYGSSVGSSETRSLPSWVGMHHSGRDDLSERHEEILRSELGDAA